MAFVDICAAHSAREGKPATAYLHGFDVAVFRVGGVLYATDRWCPHSRGDLTDGSIAGCELTCPDHGWSFDLATGTCLKKSGGRPIATYPIRVVGDRIEVDLPID